AQLAGAVTPHLDEVTNVLDALLTERRVVIRRVADDLAPPLLAGERRKPILEYGDVVVGLGNLGFGVTGSRGAKRTVVLGRVISPVLAPGRDRHPFFQEGVPAKLAHGFS